LLTFFPLASSRKPGAQPGNRNALKHGLYARHFPDEFKKKFVKWNLDDFAAEIQALRVSIDKCVEFILTPGSDHTEITKKTSAMAAAISTLVNTSRQHILFNSSDNPQMIAWLDTTRENNFFQDGDPPE
jgi:hypothetical protein